MFIMFMFLAMHLLLHLYTTSVVSGSAYDAAAHVASASQADNRAGAAAQAVADLRSSLGGVGDSAIIEVIMSSDSVTIRVQTSAPSLLPLGLTDAVGLAIDKSATVRLEGFHAITP